jgi:hypothetical protein
MIQRNTTTRHGRRRSTSALPPVQRAQDDAAHHLDPLSFRPAGPHPQRGVWSSTPVGTSYFSSSGRRMAGQEVSHDPRGKHIHMGPSRWRFSRIRRESNSVGAVQPMCRASRRPVVGDVKTIE